MITVNRLIWEKANVDHIALHGVSQQEVEEVCHGSYIVLNAREGRFLLHDPQIVMSAGHIQ